MIRPRLLSQTAVVKRKTALIHQSVLPFSQVLSRVDTQPIFVLVQLTGQSGNVSVDLTGTLNGIPQTETVVINTGGSGIARSTKRWSTLTQIATVSTGASTLKAMAVLSANQEAPTLTTIKTAVRCRLRTTRRPIRDEADGGVELVTMRIMYCNENDLQSGDVVEVDGQAYEIQDPDPIYTPAGFHHSEVVLKRLKAA